MYTAKNGADTPTAACMQTRNREKRSTLEWRSDRNHCQDTLNPGTAGPWASGSCMRVR